MNSKAYKMGFFILVVLNVALLVILALGRPKPPMQMGIKEEISRGLGFTQEQSVTFDEMAKSHRDEMRLIEEREKELVTSLFEQLFVVNTTIDKEEILKVILQLEKDKISVTFDHFEELKSMCNESQQQKFESLMEKMVPILLGETNQVPPPR